MVIATKIKPGEKITGEIFSSTSKWSKFIMSSCNSAKNLTRRKFNRENMLAAENSQSTVAAGITIGMTIYASDYASVNDHQMKSSTNPQSLLDFLTHGLL